MGTLHAITITIIIIRDFVDIHITTNTHLNNEMV